MEIDAQIAVLVYDITKKDSFESLKKWRNELKENGPKDLSKLEKKSLLKENSDCCGWK